MTMTQNVICSKCGKAWAWDVNNPKPCPDCGSGQATYNGVHVIVRDCRMKPRPLSPQEHAVIEEDECNSEPN